MAAEAILRAASFHHLRHHRDEDAKYQARLKAARNRSTPGRAKLHEAFAKLREPSATTPAIFKDPAARQFARGPADTDRVARETWGQVYTAQGRAKEQVEAAAQDSITVFFPMFFRRQPGEPEPNNGQEPWQTMHRCRSSAAGLGGWRPAEFKRISPWGGRAAGQAARRGRGRRPVAGPSHAGEDGLQLQQGAGEAAIPMAYRLATVPTAMHRPWGEAPYSPTRLLGGGMGAPRHIRGRARQHGAVEAW